MMHPWVYNQGSLRPKEDPEDTSLEICILKNNHSNAKNVL